MNQIIINGDLCAVGMRVVRGPGWEWDNQDGGKGCPGTIVDEPNDGWVSVNWDRGGTYSYRVGAEGRYDLAMYEPFSSTATTLTKGSKVQEVRRALSQSISKADSLIEKSNTKHGNSNNTNSRVSITSTGAIKVRRSTSKIKGSEGRSS